MVESLYKRNCPDCNKEIAYYSNNGYYYATKNKSKCVVCCHAKQLKHNKNEKLFRTCINCGKEIINLNKSSLCPSNQ